MNGWSLTAVNAAGTGSSEATIITRDSPHMVVDLTVSSSNHAVQLPLNATAGDLVEVCVGSSAGSFGYVWYGTTVAESGSVYYDQVDAGKCRFYRFISGPRWNRYT